MDNASKALIMAGAILISLALVGLGVYIFSMSSDLQDGAASEMQVMAAQTTNKQLTNYAGPKKRGSEVKALINLVNTLNTQQVFPDTIRYGADACLDNLAGTNVTWEAASGDTITAAGTTAPTSIRDSAWYEVQIFDELSNDGYLDTIHIKKY